MKPRDIALLQSALGHQFARTELLEQALTHSSQARELEALQAAGSARVGDNEQLEFMGDAVLGFVTTEELFRRFPGLSRRRAIQAESSPGQRKALDPGSTGTGIGTLPEPGTRRGKERRPQQDRASGRRVGSGSGRDLSGCGPGSGAALRSTSYRDAGVGAHCIERQQLPVTDYKSALQEKLQPPDGRNLPTCW